MKLYEAIVQNARLLDDPHWRDAADERQRRIIEALPSGSGFDVGTLLVSVTDQQIVLETDFHHMNEHGSYDGWTSHKVVVNASLMYGFTIDVTGPNRNDIHDYIADVFSSTLNQEFAWLNPIKEAA